MSIPSNAVAYLRVSGASQNEGDGFVRQQEAVESIATKQGIGLLRTFKETISGETQWHERPVFAEMIAHVTESITVDTIIVESMGRLARNYLVQEAMLMFFASQKINLIAADTGENITEAIQKDPIKVAMIQMQGIFSQLEKNNMVNRLRAARERKKAETGRCDGQKPFGTLPGEAEALDLMIQMRDHAYPVRRIADEMNQTTHRTRNGRPWHYASVAKILARHTP